MTRASVVALAALVAAADAACFPHDTQTGAKCVFAIAEDSFGTAMFSCLSACQARGLQGALLVPESAAEDAAAHAACEAADYAFCQFGLAEAAYDEDGLFGFAEDGEWATFPSLGVATALGCARVSRRPRRDATRARRDGPPRANL